MRVQITQLGHFAVGARSGCSVSSGRPATVAIGARPVASLPGSWGVVVDARGLNLRVKKVKGCGHGLHSTTATVTTTSAARATWWPASYCVTRWDGFRREDPAPARTTAGYWMAA